MLGGMSWQVADGYGRTAQELDNLLAVDRIVERLPCLQPFVEGRY